MRAEGRVGVLIPRPSALFLRSKPVLQRSPDLVELLRLAGARRSEEHTSELQSHLNLVCRLLLEKTTEPCVPCAPECLELTGKFRLAAPRTGSCSGVPCRRNHNSLPTSAGHRRHFATSDTDRRL